MDALRKSIGGGAAAAPGGIETGQEVEEGVGRPEGDADADRRKEAGEGGCCEEAGSQAAAEVGLVLGTLRATIADRTQHVIDGCCGVIRRQAARRILLGGYDGAFTGMGIGTILSSSRAPRIPGGPEVPAGG